MRIDAKPVEIIATPAPSADDWWTIVAAAVALAAAIGKALS